MLKNILNFYTDKSYSFMNDETNWENCRVDIQTALNIIEHLTEGTEIPRTEIKFINVYADSDMMEYRKFSGSLEQFAAKLLTDRLPSFARVISISYSTGVGTKHLNTSDCVNPHEIVYINCCAWYYYTPTLKTE